MRPPVSARLTASTVLGIVVTWMSSVGGNFFQGIGADLGIAYYTTSVALTAMLTVTICHRMVTHGRMVQRQLGEDYASVYFALLGAIVESVLPYTLSGIAFLASLGVNSPTSVGFMSVYLMLMVSGRLNTCTWPVLMACSASRRRW